MFKIYDNDDYKANIDGIECITTPELNCEWLLLGAFGLPLIAMICVTIINVCF